MARNTLLFMVVYPVKETVEDECCVQPVLALNAHSGNRGQKNASLKFIRRHVFSVSEGFQNGSFARTAISISRIPCCVPYVGRE